MRHVSTLRSALRSTLALVLLTLFAFAPMRVWASPASSPITQVTATDSIFEDRVELYWEVSSTDGIARFNISRDGTLIGIAAAGQTSYIDATAAIGTTYTYCVEAVGTGGGSLSNLCDAGTRTFRGATSFTASEDTREDGVLLAWTDNSGIEEGYRVTRTPITQPPAPGPDATFTLAPNTTTFLDDSAVQGSGYIYCAIAYNGTDTAGTVTGSCDVGRRALVTPPASVTATDGIYTDRVVVTWTDQSDTEEAYVVYRDATLLATLGADVATYTDNSAANGSDYTYCVAAVVAGNESSLIPDDVCDTGRAGNLQAPTAVSATYETFDDRIDVTWTYDGPDAVTGFNVYRAGGFITQLAGGARSYSDTEAVEGADHTYCIEAVSSPTDGAESISGQACTATPGRKAFVLPATDLTATEGDFEDQTDLSWASTSTTVMLFNVYRDGSFLATTAADVFAYTDKAGVSDQTYDYCVTAMTVSSATAAMMRQGDLAAAQRAVARYLAEAQAPQQFESTANYKARVVGGVQEVMAAQGVTAGLEESAEICAQGFRSLMPPTNVAASYNDAETHVDVTWTDASSAEKGYRVYRTLPAVEFGGPAEGDRVALMPKEELVSGSAGTVEMWFRIDGTMVAADHQSFLIWGGQSGDGFGGQTEWHLGPTGSELTFFSNETSTVLGGFITQDTWHHTALTWDGTMYRMYLDGVEVASFNGGTPDVTAWSPDILLGRPSQNGRTRFFGGQIRDVRVWNVARTQTEINQNRHTVLSGAEAGLTGLWRFDEGDGSVAANSAGGSAASLVGVEWWVGEGQIAEVSAMRSSFADYTGIPGTVYPYAVRAFDEYLTGAFSESADGSYAVSTETTGSRTLVAPTDVVASDGASETDVTLTWTDASRAETSYEIFRDGALVATLAPNEATYTDTSPTFNVVHTYGVRAIDDYGASATVVDDGFTTILSSGSVSASDTYTGEVIVTWVDVSGVETAYEITRDGTSLATLAAGTTTYTDATAASGATYEYCVVTVSGAEQAEAACDEGGLLMTTTVVSGDGAQMDLVVPTGPATIARLESLVSDDEYMAFGMPNVKQVAIFKRNGEEWEEQVVIGNSVGTTTEFGQGLALDGDYLAISAPEQSNGVIYIYKRTGETWEQQASIDDGGAGFNGYGLSLDGTTLVSHDGSDNVSVYDRSGTAWTRTARFKSGNATGQDATVSISGNLLLVGGWNYPLAAPAGAAYLYQRTGNNWNLVQTLSPAGATSQFGAAVHLEGNHVIVSEPGIAVHTWYWNGSSATNYESVSSPRGSNAFAGRPNGRTTTPYVRDDHMAIADYLIGTNDAQPLIYVYRHINGNWELIEELDPGSDVANNPAAFTISDVTISNGFIFGGSSAGTIENGGIAFVTAYPVQPTTLLASDGLYEDRIQVRWTDANKLEDGFNIYRRDDEGVLQLVGTTGINVTTFNDFSAAPGNAYEYCVTAFISELQAANSPLGESIEQCDAGWRPTNGVIAGQVLGEGGGGTQGAEIAITPAPNHALLLDGAGGYAQAAEEIVLNAGDLTIEFWAKRTTTGTTDHVVTQGTTTRKNQLLLIGFLPNNQFIFGFWANDVKTIETFTDTDWHHWAVTYDRAGDARAIYRDGVSLSITAPNSTGSYAGSGTIYIGKYSSSDFFGGQIDEVRIWDVVRTQAEIRATMSTPLTGSEDNLVAYWPFDQGARGTAPDLTSAAAHAELIGGAHWSDSAAPLAINATTDAAGNYTFSGLRYNEGETFTLTPTLNDRSFSPAFKTITLSTENPVENEVDFIDDTAFTLAGRVLYDNTVCPVADVQLFVDDVAAGSTESDGTFSLTATPSDPVNPTDTRTLTLNAGTGANVHPFSPASFTYVADQDTTGLLFYNQKTFELSGFYGGGTATCSHYVGDLTLKIVTEDGCFEQEVPLTSFGNYNVALPPQEYLVSVSVDPNTIPAGIDAADVIDYFEDLGQMEVNLTTSADTLDVAYRAPLAVTISGFPNVSNSCAVSGYSVVDSGGSALRTLPAVPVIGEYATVPLTIAVVEDYGTSGTCPVTDGTLTIFDSIGDVEDPQEIAVTSGQVNYTTVGASPDVITNRFDSGEDRSFQKSFTVVAEVEGQAPVTETVWAVVEGFRERQSTFVTFSTDEMPLWILHDPPGSNSYAYVEEGFTSCRRLTDIEFTSSEIGAVTNFEVGFKSSTGVAAGAVMITEGGVGFYNRFDALETTGRTKLGTGPNREICITTKQRFQTSAEPYSVSDHLYVGAGLNLIFAEADRLTATGSCTITKDLTLAADLNLENAFSTTYLYSENHIEHTLLPELEDLAGLIGNGGNGNATSNDTGILLGASGPVTQIMVEKAQANWQAHLDLGVTNTEEGVLVGATNYSFSGGGSAFESAIGVDTTATTDLVYTVDVNDYTEEFGVLATKFGYDNRVGARFSFTTESVTEKEETETSSQTIGYVLSDPDVGDFFSVDVGTDPVYGTPVFQTVSGRSSVPHEEGTQQRDNPEIEINPPVIYDADPDEAANFQVTVINNSESAERRVYTLAVPGETNTRNLSITTTGDLLGGERLESFTLEPGEARTINLDVFASPSAYSYEDVGLVLYSAEEFELWLKDPRREFGASDMAFFSVYFTAPCSEMTLSGLNQGWTYSNGATPLSFAVGNYNLDPDLVLNGDLANMTIGAEYKRSGTGDWIPITSETGDVLEANGMSSIVVNWTPPQDGTYEVRGFSSCQTSTGLELIDGASIYGTVDTGIPTAFGTPEPADGSLGLGDIASVTFQEDLNCATINDATGTANVQIGVLDDSGTVTSTLTDVTATCNDRTLTIAPTGGWNDTHDGNRYEVRILSDQPTVPADELGNEIQSDIVWQFVVQRSGFAWNPVNLVVATTVGTERTLTADLVNGRAEDLDFTVNGPLSLALLDGSGNPTATTVDLEADYTSGTIPSGGQWPVSFTVPGTLSEGIWSGQVDAEGTVYGQSIGSVPLFARVQVGCAPVWNANDVDGSDFAYSMSVTGRLAIDGIVSDDTADFVAAFVGNELRGLANVTDGNGTVYLTVYSNSLQGELVTFQAYDASACTSYPGAEQTVLFASGDVVGSPAQPQAINATLTAPQQQIALNSGWTWFSLNREPASTAIADVLASISATPGDVVKNHSAFAIYDADNGWVGGLTNIDVGQAYQIQLASANTLTITGNAVDLNATQVEVDPNWNWIGFLPQVSQDVATALATLSPTDGDLIKSQYQFAQYDASSSQWVGSLTQLEPGLGYQLYSAATGTIVYSATAASSVVASATTGQQAAKRVVATADLDHGATLEQAHLAEDVDRMTAPSEETRVFDKSAAEPMEADTGDAPQWQPSAFAHTMTLVAALPADLAVTPELRLWAVDGNGAIRGEAVPVFVPEKQAHYAFAMLYSDGAEDETLHLHLATHPDHDAQATATVTFHVGARQGSLAEPVQLLAPQAAIDLPQAYALEANYPNPFNPTTSIRYALPQTSEVRLVVYDVIGREVARLVEGEQKAGWHTISFDGRGLASGMYVYRLEAGDYKQVQRMTLLK